MIIEHKDITFKEIRDNTIKNLGNEYTERKLEIFYKGKSINKFWDLPPLWNGEECVLNGVNYDIDMELVTNEIELQTGLDSI